MLYVLIGEDDFSVRESLEEIKRGLGDPSALATNTAVLGADVTIDKLRGACETVPFLGEKRLVIVEGLLERFEPRARPGPKKRPAEPTDEAKSVAAYITRIPDFTVLALTGGRISPRNPLLTGLSGKAEVKTFPQLRAVALQQWIGRRVAQAGGSMSPQAIALLARFVGSNLWTMANEIDKLLLFTAGRRIEEQDVKAVTSYAQEASVFAMVDAILGSRADMAGQLLQKLIQWGAAPAYLLVMLSRQTQMIVRAKELTAQRRPRAEIQERLGLPDFALRRTLEQSGRFSLERLREVYHRLLEADLSIKTGMYDGELALSILVAELCQERQARAYRR